MKIIMFPPGTVSAGENISLPSYAPAVKNIVAAYHIVLSDASTTASITSLTVTSSTPSSGEIQLIDESTVKLGDATTDLSILVLVVVAKGEYSGA